MVEEKKVINEEASAAIRERWNDFSHGYTSTIEQFTSQLVVPLYFHTKAHTSGRHLDVGCGSGVGALMLTGMLANPTSKGHLLVTSDLSPEMQ